MLRQITFAISMIAALATGAVAQDGTDPVSGDDCCLSEPVAEPAALDPVIDDDLAPNLGDDTIEPLTPVLDDDVAVNEASSDDVVLEPVTDDDFAPNLPGVNLLPTNNTQNTKPAARDAKMSGRQLQVKVPLRDDGSMPDVSIRRSEDGVDGEIWVDGLKRVILKGRPEILVGDLDMVYS